VGAPRQPLVRAALASAVAPRLLERATRGALAGLWLGVLSDAGLRALDERYYDAEAVYRTADWNERGLFDWERALVDEHLAGGERVLVPGCGGGREVLALLEDGFDAIGYEPHPGLAAYAGELLAARGHPDRVHESPRSRLAPGAHRCDCVMVGWVAYSLVPGRAARVRFLAEARECLLPGGSVILSFFAAAQHGRQLRATLAIANALRAARGRARLELGDTLAPNLVHVFTREELAEEVSAAGLALAEYRIVGTAEGPVSFVAAVAGAA
jgi:SAM-dependent methyltransferase